MYAFKVNFIRNGNSSRLNYANEYKSICHINEQNHYAIYQKMSSITLIYKSLLTSTSLNNYDDFIIIKATANQKIRNIDNII